MADFGDALGGGAGLAGAAFGLTNPVGLALSGASLLYGIGSSISNAQKQREADAKLKAQLANRPTYKPSEYIKNMLADARARANAESPAVRLAYEQARQQAADRTINAQISSASGSQALGEAASAQQDFQKIAPQLAAQQEAYHQANLNRMDNATQAMTAEERAAHEDAISKYNDMINYHLGKVGAYNQNKMMGMSAAIQGASGVAGSFGKVTPNPNVYNGPKMNFKLATPKAGAPLDIKGNPFFGSHIQTRDVALGNQPYGMMANQATPQSPYSDLNNYTNYGRWNNLSLRSPFTPQ